MFESLEVRALLNATLDGSGLLTINGSPSSDIILVSSAGDNLVVMTQPENYNQSFPLSSVKTILVNCEAGHDLLSIEQAITIPSTVNGGAGNDTLSGGGGNDLLMGGDGDDLLDGGLGSDGLYGEAGTDTADYRSRTADLNISLEFAAPQNNDGEAGERDNVDITVDIVLGGSGNDTLSVISTIDGRAFYGNGGNDTLRGGGGPDRLNGGPGDDSLLGSGGNDLLIGGPGKDVFRGGSGIDTVSYAYSRLPVVVDIDGHSDDGTFREQDNVHLDCENLIGGSGNDRLVGHTSTTRNNRLDGGPGHDYLEGRNGNDVLVGGPGNDTLNGGNGNDTLRPGTGADRLIGGRSLGDVAFVTGVSGSNDLIDPDVEEVRIL